MSTETLEIRKNEIHLWQAHMKKPPIQLTELTALLSSEEITKANQYHFPIDKDRFIFRRGVLRHLLAWYGNCSPRSIVFTQNTYGKPAVEAPASTHGITFNVSHSGDCVLIGIAKDRELGVDIEYVRAFEHADQVVRDFFSEREKNAFQALTPETKAEAFFTCWTQKEAYIKARGEGLSHPLDAFSTDVQMHGHNQWIPVLDRDEQNLNWNLRKIQSPDGTIAMVASEGKDWELVYQKW